MLSAECPSSTSARPSNRDCSTKREHLEAIRAHGLVPHWPEADSEPDAVYLTDDFGQAVANSGGIDRETGTFDLDCPLVADVTGLPMFRLSFYTCMLPIPPERITSITEQPGSCGASYGKKRGGDERRGHLGVGAEQFYR
jgi:hypothetical protein